MCKVEVNFISVKLGEVNITTENKNKKRKYEQENVSFKKFYNNGKTIICNSSVKNYKVNNLHRYYQTNHSEFSNLYPPNLPKMR